MNARSPQVSIGLPVFNEERYVSAALDDLLGQDFRDFELVISDNASTDGTLRICQEYAARDARIRLYRNERNQGPVENFRIVLSHARARYFMWAAADDRWAPGFISALFDELEAHPEAGVAMCATDRVLENGDPLDTIRFLGRDDPNGLSYYQTLQGLTSSRKYNLFIYGLFRTGLLKRAMHTFPDVLGGDRLFMCQMALATKFRYVDRVLFTRTHRADHERSYRALARQGGTPFSQVVALGRMFLRSRVIPFGRKIGVLPALWRYGLLTFGKAYASTTTWRVINTMMNVGLPVTRKRLDAALLAFATSAVLVGVAATAGGLLWAIAAGLLAGGFWGALALARLIWSIRSGVQVLLREAKASRDLHQAVKASQEQLEQRLTAVAQEFRIAVSTTQGDLGQRLTDLAQEFRSTAAQQSKVSRELFESIQTLGATLQTAVSTTQGGLGQRLTDLAQEFRSTAAQQSRVSHELHYVVQASLDQLNHRVTDMAQEFGTTAAQQLSPLHREMRYLTDIVVGDGPSPPADKGNLLAKYALERHEKHRKLVAFARAVEESRIRELHLTEIFSGIERVALPIGAINELTGHVNKVNMLYVCAIAKHLGARKIFEFGTYQGRTTYHLTLASKGAHVWTLNLPPEADPRYAPHLGRYFLGTDREQFITQIYGDSREFDTTPFRRQFDFIFVDGGHSYDLVKNDTSKAFEMLKPGGAILWHDYAAKTEELVRFFRDFTQEQPLFRIKRTCLLLNLDGVDPMTFTLHPMLPSLERDFYESEPYWIEELYHA